MLTAMHLMTKRIWAGWRPGNRDLVAVLLFISVLLVAGGAEAQQAAPVQQAPSSTATVNVLVNTTLGEIHVALESQRAPVTVANFLRYVDGRRFDNITLYRAVKVDAEGNYGLVQGGLKGETKKLFKPIAHESPAATGLSHVDGAISMARTDPGTATADFFFVVGNLVSLDGSRDGTDPGYAAFGHVTQGMEILKQVLLAPRSEDAGDGSMKGQMLSEPVRILSIRRQD
jgi:peptidyl-prolyl cis-trans isomerase A (cyclophilin A)